MHKYTRQGRVLIGVRRCGSGHRIEVHDTGPGLHGVAFRQALVRNQRLERDLLVAEGSGLGLAVAKEIADANDWALTSCAGRRGGASIRLDLSGASTGLPSSNDVEAIQVRAYIASAST
jgi:signal transduction histidine kinase